MPRVIFVKKARKDYPDRGVKKGESYYYWSTKSGSRFVKRYSKKRPSRSQLTQSEFLGSMYDAEDSLTATLDEFRTNETEELEDLATACEDTASMVREAGELCEEKYNNMPDGLQQGDTGQLLETRADQCNTIADELESIAGDIRSMEKTERDEAISLVEDISWEYE